ncbi:MAG: TIGR01777 family protein [Saprospiraceae bacterium]|nr:MAG: TIGR01777 family protein [Saprospiraceae bacterium]
MTILIAGGTGLLGTHLSQVLRLNGFTVAHLSRRKNLQAEYPAYLWDPEKDFVEEEAVEQAAVIINLAGAGIAAKRWTAARKKHIIESRVNSNLLLKKAILQKKEPTKIYIAASAIGYYGNRGEELLSEEASPGETGYLPKVVTEWEHAIREAATTGVRTVALRVGIVLSPHGGALEKMLLPFEFFLGIYFGDGRQWYSWIHIADLCRMFLEAIKNEKMQGFYNAVAPNPVRNKDLVMALREAIVKPALISSAPAFALRAAMGEMAEMILDGAKVSPQKIMDAGFRFDHPELLPALRDLLARRV